MLKFFPSCPINGREAKYISVFLFVSANRSNLLFVLPPKKSFFIFVILFAIEKYPTIIRNTNAQYEEISVTATFLPTDEDGECIDYEEILKELADTILIPNYLEEMNKEPKKGSIYKCKGRFKFNEYCDDDEMEW